MALFVYKKYQPTLIMNSKHLVLGLGATLIFSATAGLLAFRDPNRTPVQTESLAQADEIEWMDWTAAVKANEANPKKIFVSVYTDWCGWCKRMDASTFKDPNVQAYLNENFYAVKFNAEQKEDIVYDGNTFSFQRSGNRGYHELAAAMLDNRLSYPSIVYFNDKMERLMISPGYKDADALLTELKQAKGM